MIGFLRMLTEVCQYLPLTLLSLLSIAGFGWEIARHNKVVRLSPELADFDLAQYKIEPWKEFIVIIPMKKRVFDSA